MTGLADWETEGATARAPRPGDGVRAPAGVRALTWTGSVLVLVAVVLYALAAGTAPVTDGTAVHGFAPFVVLVVVATGAAVLGGVAFLLRILAGVLALR